MGYVLMPINELYHSGVPGMRHGVRRYQNLDGTLTELGKIHYRKMREGANSTSADGNEDIEYPSLKAKIKREKKVVPKSDFVRIENLDNQALNEAINRMRLEKQYKEALRDLDALDAKHGLRSSIKKALGEAATTAVKDVATKTMTAALTALVANIINSDNNSGKKQQENSSNNNSGKKQQENSGNSNSGKNDDIRSKGSSKPEPSAAFDPSSFRYTVEPMSFNNLRKGYGDNQAFDNRFFSSLMPRSEQPNSNKKSKRKK